MPKKKRWGVWIDVDSTNMTCLRQFENAKVGRYEENFKSIEKKNMEKLSWAKKVDTKNNFAFLFPKSHYDYLMKIYKKILQL